jgi:hypothetical protein
LNSTEGPTHDILTLKFEMSQCLFIQIKRDCIGTYPITQVTLKNLYTYSKLREEPLIENDDLNLLLNLKSASVKINTLGLEEYDPMTKHKSIFETSKKNLLLIRYYGH